MKTYAIIMLSILLPFLQVHADIINGYLHEKQMLEKYIKICSASLKEPESENCVKQYQNDLMHLQKVYEIIERKYAETEKLLSDLKLIDPDLYEAVDKVTDADGTLTTVYVKYVSRLAKEFRYNLNKYHYVLAYTSCQQSMINEHVCFSEFGEYTISVTIGKCRDSLIVLAHEFGHALYIVPNHKTYSEFIMKYADCLATQKFGGGHHPSDPSQEFVQAIEDSFLEKYNTYLTKLENDINL